MNQMYSCILRTPLSDLAYAVDIKDHNMTVNEECKKIVLEYGNCVEAYGVEKSKEKCADLLHDMVECTFRTKLEGRIVEIKNQHKKVIKGGKPHVDSPAMDVTHPVE